MFETLGTVYRGLAEFDRADGLLTQAVEERRRLADGQGDAADSLALMRLYQGDESALDDLAAATRAAWIRVKELAAKRLRK